MIETAWTFWRLNVRKHLSKIFATTHPYLSGLLAAWIVLYSDLKFKPFVLANFFVPYDTVVFGFTATAIALSIALPSERFIKFLSEVRDGTTPFRDFLFVMVWNGVIHIFAFFLFIPVIIMGDGMTFAEGKFLSDGVVMSSRESPGAMHVYVFILLWLQFYACLQFFVTTIGIYELADVYGAYCAGLRKADDKNRQGS